jgi:hypothetical protein
MADLIPLLERPSGQHRSVQCDQVPSGTGVGVVGFARLSPRGDCRCPTGEWVWDGVRGRVNCVIHQRGMNGSHEVSNTTRPPTAVSAAALWWRASRTEDDNDRAYQTVVQ